MRQLTVAMVLLAGCGRVGFDGLVTTDDGTPDASVADGGTGTVRVVVGYISTPSTPAPDILVWSNRPDGELQATALTTATGEAMLEVTSGGWISADLREDNGSIVSRYGVQLDDTVYLGGKAAPPCQSEGSATLEFPLRAGSNYYEVAGRCPGVGHFPGSDPTEVALGVPLIPDPFDLTILAYNGADLVGSIARPDLMLATGEQLGFTDTDWRSPIAADVGFMGIPADVVGLRSQFDFSTGSVRGNAGRATLDQKGSTDITAQVPVADVGAERMRVRVDLERGPLEVSSVLVADAPIGLTELPPLPPMPRDITLRDAGSITWTGSSGSVDLLQLVTIRELFSARSSVAPPDPTWSVLAPPGTQEIVPPELPPGVELPSPVSAILVLVADDSTIDGWDDARARFDNELPWPSALEEDTDRTGELAVSLTAYFAE